MDEFAIVVKLDEGNTLDSLWSALKSASIKVDSIFPMSNGQNPAPPRQADVSVNALFGTKEPTKKIGRPRKRDRSIQTIFDFLKAKDGVHWTALRDALKKDGYAEGTASARLYELKTKYGLVEQRPDDLYYLTKLGRKTKIVPR